MEFLKNLFTNDNSIIGLCGLEGENDDITNNLNCIFREHHYAPAVNLAQKNKEYLRNIFAG